MKIKLNAKGQKAATMPDGTVIYKEGTILDAFRISKGKYAGCAAFLDEYGIAIVLTDEFEEIKPTRIRVNEAGQKAATAPGVVEAHAGDILDAWPVTEGEFAGGVFVEDAGILMPGEFDEVIRIRLTREGQASCCSGDPITDPKEGDEFYAIRRTDLSGWKTPISRLCNLFGILIEGDYEEIK